MKQDLYVYSREWAYKDIPSKIIIEELLEDDTGKQDIVDYKFLCYQGQPRYIVYDQDRFSGHKRNIYDIDWNLIPCTTDVPKIEESIEKPLLLDEMLRIATKLSEDFPFVRVDLYCVNKKIYFGELTFYPWSGYVKFDPEECDVLLGEKININEIRRDNK